MTENKVIEIHCKQCKKHFFDYMIEFEENSDREKQLRLQLYRTL